MIISFPFLRAKDLRTFLFIMRTLFLNSTVHRGYIHKVSVHLVQKYFPHDCSTDSIYCSEQKKESDKNNIKTRQQRDRRDSVTVRDVISRKINISLSLPIHRARRQAVSASVVISDPLEA